MGNVEKQQRMVKAWTTGDYDTFCQLVAADCVIESVALGGRTIAGRERLIEELESIRGTLWSLGPMKVRELDHETVLSQATVRTPLPDGGHSISSVYWLTTYRDGKIAKTSAFRSESAARHAWGVQVIA